MIHPRRQFRLHNLAGEVDPQAHRTSARPQAYMTQKERDHYEMVVELRHKGVITTSSDVFEAPDEKILKVYSSKVSSTLKNMIQQSTADIASSSQE